MLERPTRDKHSSLLRTFVNYGRKKFFKRAQIITGDNLTVVLAEFSTLSLAVFLL